MIPVIDYTEANVGQMRADYAARRARLYAPGPEPVSTAPARRFISPPKPRRTAKQTLDDAVASFLAKPDKDAPGPIRDWLNLASPETTKPGAATRIIALVSEVTGVSRLDLISERRTQNIVIPRQICFYLMKTCTPLSLPMIGRQMGGRDHTTVLHGSRRIATLIDQRADIRALVESLTNRARASA